MTPMENWIDRETGIRNEAEIIYKNPNPRRPRQALKEQRLQRTYGFPKSHSATHLGHC